MCNIETFKCKNHCLVSIIIIKRPSQFFVFFNQSIKVVQLFKGDMYIDRKKLTRILILQHLKKIMIN